MVPQSTNMDNEKGEQSTNMDNGKEQQSTNTNDEEEKHSTTTTEDKNQSIQPTEEEIKIIYNTYADLYQVLMIHFKKEPQQIQIERQQSILEHIDRQRKLLEKYIHIKHNGQDLTREDLNLIILSYITIKHTLEEIVELIEYQSGNNTIDKNEQISTISSFYHT